MNILTIILVILSAYQCEASEANCTLIFNLFYNLPIVRINGPEKYFAITKNATYYYIQESTLGSYVDLWSMEDPANVFKTEIEFDVDNADIESLYEIGGGSYVITTASNGDNKLFQKEPSVLVMDLFIFTEGISKGYEVESAEKFFFSTKGGELGYISSSQLPMMIPVFMDLMFNTPAYCYVSLDETLIANAFETDTFVKVYSTSNDSVVATLQTGSDDQNYLCVFTQTHLLIFPFDSPNIYMYKMSDWSLEQIFVSAHHKKRQGTYFALENTVVCIDEDTESAYAFDLNIMNEYDIDLGGFSVKKMSSDSPNYMAFTGVTGTIALIFEIQSECTDEPELEPEPEPEPEPGTEPGTEPTIEGQCGENCEKCESATYCDECKIEYTENDGECVSNADVVGENGFNNKAFTTVTTESMNSVGGLNSLPASRKVLKPLFAFFSNFDHLWLYVYHEREYGYHMSSLFDTILILEQDKWESLSEILPKSVNNDLDEVETKLIYIEEREKKKVKENKSKFVEIEGKNRSFMGANIDFFLMNIPLILILFLVMKFIFHLLRNYKVSVYIRQFSFVAYLFLMLAEGNIQSFTYFLASDCMQLFNLSFTGKLLSILTVTLFAFLLCFSLSFFFMVKHFYKKKTKYFTDNYRQSFKSIKFLTFEYVLINILLGFIHVVFEDFYNTQAILLIITESIYACILVCIIRGKKNCLVEFKLFITLNLFTCLLRILLNITFLVDYPMIVKPSELNSISYIQGYIIICYLFTWVVAILYSIFCIINPLAKQICCNSKEIKPTTKELEKNMPNKKIFALGKRERINVQRVSYINTPMLANLIANEHKNNKNLNLNDSFATTIKNEFEQNETPQTITTSARGEIKKISKRFSQRLSNRFSSRCSLINKKYTADTLIIHNLDNIEENQETEESEIGGSKKKGLGLVANNHHEK